MTGIETNKSKPHRLDKYLDYLTAGKTVQLSPAQLERFDLMSRVHSWQCNFFSPQQCVKILEEKHGQQKSNSYAILQDSDFVFGKMGKFNIDAQLVVQYERAHLNSQLIKTDKNLTDAEKGLALDKIQDKMLRILDRIEARSGSKAVANIPQINVIINTGPRPEPKPETIDIDAEIMEE